MVCPHFELTLTYTSIQLLLGATVSSDQVTVHFLKFQTLVACQKRSRQTEQTQTRLLLKKQSDQGLPCFLF